MPSQPPIVPQQPSVPAQVPVVPQNQPASSQAPKPKPAPIQTEESKEARPSPKKKGKNKNDPAKSQPESPKGLQRPPNSQLFPDKSQPPSPKKLKDPCPSCRGTESTVVIINGDSPQKSCDECAKEYTDILPLSTFPQLTSSDIVDFAVEKFKYVKTIKKRIEENLTKIDKFKVKAEKEFEAASKELQNCKSRMFAKVTTTRRDIESKLTTALAEIEANLCRRDFNPRSEFALVMWEKRVEDVNFDLFVSRCGPPDIIGEVTRTIDYEASGIFALNCIPIISDNQIVKFHCKREDWCPSIPLQSEIHVSPESVFTYVGEQDVMCSGGREEDSGAATATAYIVNIATGSTKTLPSMETPRYRHGSICIGQNSYMFGGQNPDFLTACEKFCLNHQEREWSQMKEMLVPRASFNPFVYQKLIYIMGGSNTRDCELYDFTRNTFLPLSFFLPESLPVLALFLEPNVLLFQGNKGLIWKPVHKSTKSTTINRDMPCQSKPLTDFGSDESDREEIPIWSNFTPLIVGGRLYFASNQAKEVIRQELGGRYAVRTFSFL
jgi:hypothetical protein